MNKSELIDHVASTSGLSKKDAAAAVNAVFDSGGPQNLDRPLRWEAVRFPKGVNHELEASESFAGVQG